ncbi:phage tail assembly protein [Hydrogenovibrio sp. 3SP14C1]|nr:phage tail assembly protein [Hydrogenovibrio sp. 3SP14C1]MDG4813048.1 phage tail assembly protein [Hydrogenovibrio sp. 3SP14C1]
MSETFKLSHPIMDGATELKELKYRRPLANDLIAMDEHEGHMNRTKVMICQLTDLPPDVIGSMDGKDFLDFGEILQGFLA